MNVNNTVEKDEEEVGEKSIEMCHDEWNLNALLINNYCNFGLMHT